MREEKYYKVKLQKIVVDYLKILKKYYTYHELSERLGFSETLLCRYAKSDILPSPSKASTMLEKLVKAGFLEELLARTVKVDELGVVNIDVIAFNMDILRLAAFRALYEFSELKVTKVLTAATNGVPLATLTAEVLGVGLAVAKKDRSSSNIAYIEGSYFSPSPPLWTSFYLPVHALSKRDKVLIVDDLLQSGRTLQTLRKMCEKAGAEPVAVYALLAVGDTWTKSLPSEVKKVVVVKKLKVV